jgi:hypothetical protein
MKISLYALLIAMALGCRGGDRLVPATITTQPPIVDAGGDAGYTTVVVPPPDGGGDAGDDGCMPAGAQESCYTGPPSTIGADGCHSGTTTCGPQGFWGTCEGESVPTPLLTDIVFILENTDDTCFDGMGLSEFVQVEETAVNFVLDYPEVNFRWGVLTTPGCDAAWPGWTDAGYALYQPLTGEVGGVQATGNQCVVSSNDAPLCATAPAPAFAVLLDQLQGKPIPWDLGAQHFIILFTSAGMPSQQVIGETLSYDMMGSNGVQTLMFINPLDAQSCNGCGQVFPLGTDVQMLQQLETSFTTVLTCQ